MSWGWREWKCAECGTESTPQKRNGPEGRKTLCNACGTRTMREAQRKAQPKQENNLNVLAEAASKTQPKQENLLNVLAEVASKDQDTYLDSSVLVKE